MKVFRGKVSKFSDQKIALGEYLQQLSALTMAEVTDAARKGAVFVQRQSKGKIQRARDSRLILDPSDQVIFNYDKRVLSLPEFKDPISLEDNENYGIWIKPAGIMPQGSESGDHTSLLRAVEMKKKKEVYLVHRLDRETTGLMAIAYNSQAAAKLSELFQKNLIKKTYQAVVLGDMKVGDKATIKASLDDKEAISHYKVLASKGLRSLLEVEIETGRLHQIRRHLDFIGHPVMGDPKYGKGNKNREGLKLLAKSLSFQDPWNKETRSWTMEESLTV